MSYPGGHVAGILYHHRAGEVLVKMVYIFTHSAILKKKKEVKCHALFGKWYKVKAKTNPALTGR